MALAEFDLSRWAEQLDSAPDLQALWSQTVAFFNHAGFLGVSYAVFSRGQPGEVSLLLRDGIPDHVHQGFIDLGMGRHDVNFRFALATGQPSLRSRTLKEVTLSPEERLHHVGREALAYGDSLALPVYGPNNYIGVIALGCPETPESFEQVNWMWLHMAALCAHLRGLRLHPAGEAEAHTLSEPEVEVLIWVAQGKSNAVIGNILAIGTGASGTVGGSFFRPGAEEIGGVWHLSDGTNTALGTLAGIKK